MFGFENVDRILEYRKDDYAFFLAPVDLSKVPGYTDIVKRPMDFGTMTTKVSRGKYRSLEEFASDFRLVTSNAKAFNAPGTIYYSEAERIETFGLDHISRAAATVIEYETDWNIEIEQDDESAALNADEYDGDVLTPMDIDGSLAASPAPSANLGQPTKRGARGPYKKTLGNIVPDNHIDIEGRLPGSKDGLAAFPPGSDWAKLMLALKWKGKRYRTKKERLRIEKEGPPYCTDGSLDFSEIEDPFSVLSVFVPDPPSRPRLTPLFPCNSSLPAPVKITPHEYPPSLESKSDFNSSKRSHWTIMRNATTRAYKSREKEEEEDLPSWQLPREAHALDFGAYGDLGGEMGRRGLGTEEAVLDAIREDADETMDVEESDQDKYWNYKRAADAQDYIWDVVYGGVDGLAYVRSLAEFVRPPVVSVKNEEGEVLEPSCMALGMPLAEYVENYIVDPMTDGLHSVFRTTAQYLVDPSSPLPAPITAQLDLSLHAYPSISNVLAHLQQVTSEVIDMAALIRLPAELFLSESEWAGARWKEDRARKAEGDKAQEMGFSEPNASEYLAFAIKSHQEAQAQDANSSVGYTQDDPELLQYVLDHVAHVIADLEADRKDGTWELKLESKNGDEEDPRLRDLRLNLLALAKRAPLDKIQRLPAELVPEHIRHYVPIVAPLSL